MQRKDLVYYTIGGSPAYVKLLAASIESLYHFGGNRNNYDVMVMCDEHFKEHIADLDIDHIHVTPTNATPVHASMRKTEIFRWGRIQKYDRVLFLDCDLIVGQPIDAIFKTLERSDALYVNIEKKDPEFHKHFFYSRKDQPYSDAELKSLIEDNVYVFNAGQFAFRVSPVMREHFEAVARDTEQYDVNVHFYEQSFMNSYFNRARAVDYAIDPYVRLFAQDHMAEPPKAINHFCGSDAKLERMQTYYEFIKKISPPQPPPYIGLRYIVLIIICCIVALIVGLALEFMRK